MYMYIYISIRYIIVNIIYKFDSSVIVLVESCRYTVLRIHMDLFFLYYNNNDKSISHNYLESAT